MALSGVEGPFDRLTAPSEVEGPQEYYLYFEDFEPRPDNESGRKPKFCKGLMIIDVHTHIFPPEVRKSRAAFFEGEADFAAIYQDETARMIGAAELVAAMDRAGVDKAAAFGFPWSDEAHARAGNEYVREAQTRYPGRIVGLASLNPVMDWAPREAARALDAGLFGLGELALYGRGFDPEALDRLAALGRLCRERNRLMLVHVNEPIGHRYPGKAPLTLAMIYDLVRSLPEVKLVLAHWGGGLFFYHLLIREVPAALTNVFVDTAASPFLYRPEIYPLACQIIGPEKVLFGSDFPLIEPERYFREIEASGLEAEAARLVKGEAAARLLREVGAF